MSTSSNSRLQRRFDELLRISGSRSGSRSPTGSTTRQNEQEQTDSPTIAVTPPPTAPSPSTTMSRALTAINAHDSHHLWSRARNLNPMVDMHMLDYLSECDNNLMCPICRSPFVEPVVLDECGHCFCRDCLRRSWNATQYTPGILRGNCPSCRTGSKLIGGGNVSRILVNILDELSVRCPRHTEGCSMILKRGDVKDHVDAYCGYTWIPCPQDDCGEPVRRKDARECLHYDVTCIDCRQTTLMSNLETHWTSECPDRKVSCDKCKTSVFYREIDSHSRNTCPAITIPCTGADYGCTFRSKRGAINQHTKQCTFASLAPFFEAQKQRMDAQEEEHKLLYRRLTILENGFRSLEDTINTTSEPAAATTQPVEPFLPAPAPPTTDRSEIDFDYPVQADIEDDAGPFASPYHHLLSLHENLRGEVSRINNALRDLEGRQSIMILNENMRVREDMAYLGGQVGGLSRQVGWLTSTRLQGGAGGLAGAGAGAAAAAEAGPSDSGAATRMGIGRRPTDEGRTKL